MTHQPELIPDQPSSAPPSERDVDREAYLARLREYLQDPDFRAIEGFPIGEDEDILALSDPPYYTACPNPFLSEIIRQWQQERDDLRENLGLPDDTGNNDKGEVTYRREPFAADVSGGKHNPIYYAHSYHTKVPHKAVMRYVLHYTDPGDIVFDGFCGTGMTGVAAQICADRDEVQDLGYRVDEDGWVHNGEEVISRLGARKAVLAELSPAATFIAHNYNTPVNVSAFESEAKQIFRKVEDELGWMYETWHPHCDDPKRVKGNIHYTIWSDVFVCPICDKEIIYWDAVIDLETGKITDGFQCPSCGTEQSKSTLDRLWETSYDKALETTTRWAKHVPVRVNYSVGRNRYDKAPDQKDLELVQLTRQQSVPYWFPTDRLPEGEKTRDPLSVGVTRVHDFYTRRNLAVIAALVNEARERQATQTLFVLSSINTHISRMRRYQAAKPGGTPSLPGTLYISSLPVELSPFDGFPRKLGYVRRGFEARDFNHDAVVSTGSSTDLRGIPSEHVDYIFVDPPFGSNLMYSELNFLWEAWLRVLTNNTTEAVVNEAQGKALPQYQRLMEQCFQEFYRVLKPGRWMTIEFHNSRNSVWNAIQQALLRAGFVVADVRTSSHLTLSREIGHEPNG